eukprot:SAG25_NODE_13924_length_261_cov_0.641975_1_plen_50_part_01
MVLLLACDCLACHGQAGHARCTAIVNLDRQYLVACDDDERVSCWLCVLSV